MVRFSLLSIVPLTLAFFIGCSPGDDEAATSENNFDSSADGDSEGGIGNGSGDGSLINFDGGSNGPSPTTTIATLGVDDFAEFPQYFAVRKSPTEGGDANEKARCEALLPGLKGLPFYGNSSTCVIFNPGILGAIPDETQRRAVLRQGYEEVRVRVGQDSVGGRKLAVEFFLDLLNDTPEHNEMYLRDHLAAAKAAHMPLIIALDAVNWWDNRPDLWNFFDPAKPGYDPKNTDNVEWDNAFGVNPPRIFWRNWGAQIRIDTPIPNFAATGYREAIRTLLNRYLPIIRDFETHLAPQDRYLYGGVIVGTEINVGSNHYVYPNPNQYINSPRECDPGQEWKGGACPKPAAGACSAYNHNICPEGTTPIGYHAAADLKLGSTINGGVIDAIVRDYLSYINHVIVVENHLPTHKIYSHVATPSFSVAQFATMVPGWSMYYGGATNIGTTAGPFIESSEAQRMAPWASPEWLPYGVADNDSRATWVAAIENALNYRNNHMISVANWEGVYKNPRAMGALTDVMTAPRLDACSFSPRMIIGSADIEGKTGIRVSFVSFNVATYLTGSTKPDLNGVGGLAVADAVNAQLDPLTRSFFFQSDAPQKIYVQLATDGCPRNGAGQRMLSPVVELTVKGDGQAPGGTHLFSATDNDVVTLSWEVPLPILQAGYDAYLNVTTDSTFTNVDVANEIATGKTMYVRDGFDPNKKYYARIAVDSGGVRSYSNVVTIH